jgi:alpha-tubulin suppressor-like RCC1 family protein
MLVGASLVPVLACSDEDPQPAPDPGTGPLGEFILALSQTSGDHEYRVLGTINVLDDASEFVTSVEAEADSPPIHTITLAPGDYTIEVDTGYSCTYEGPTEGYVGCTYIAAVPDPFTIEVGETTQVVLRFNFEFEQQGEVIDVGSTGEAEISLGAEQNVMEFCGSNLACADGEVCASLDAASPTCYVPCEIDGDCANDEHCLVGMAESTPIGVCVPGAPACTNGDTTNVAPCTWECVAGEWQIQSCDIVDVSISGNHGCAVTEAGGVYCWGNNAYRQLGQATGNSYATPVLVPGISNATQVASGGHDQFGGHTCVITTGNTVYCWGQGPVLGNDPSPGVSLSVPTQVSGLTDVVSISAGHSHTCVARTGGTVHCWGNNFQGKLGNGQSTQSLVPVQAVGITNAVRVAVNWQTSCATTTDNHAYCWGAGTSGQLGNGADSNSNVPVLVSSLSTAASVAPAYQHTCAVTTTGTGKCWGYNFAGWLGDGTTDPSSVPVDVDNLTGAASVAAGEFHVCVVTSGGKVLCWGRNGEGQLGNANVGDTNPGPGSTFPVEAMGISNATAVSAAADSTCALTATGRVFCWGAGGYGQLGNGLGTDTNVPIEVAWDRP